MSNSNNTLPDIYKFSLDIVQCLAIILSLAQYTNCRTEFILGQSICFTKSISPSHLYSLFSNLDIINKLGLYMNSCYWAKTVIKLLNLTNSVYNFSNSGSKTENKDIKQHSGKVGPSPMTPGHPGPSGITRTLIIPGTPSNLWIP